MAFFFFARVCLEKKSEILRLRIFLSVNTSSRTTLLCLFLSVNKFSNKEDVVSLSLWCIIIIIIIIISFFYFSLNFY